MYKPKHFIIQEFVSPAVYRRYGETAWQFLDPRLLVFMDWLREKLGKKITINNWHWGGEFTQRGLRENLSEIVKTKTDKSVLYLSGHVFGQAADFDVEGMKAGEIRAWLIENQEELPCPIRMESMVHWNHIDVRDTGNQVYIFQP